MINYVVYSNTDYLPILRIWIDYAEEKGNITLLINQNDLIEQEFYDRFDKVIFYDNELPYAGRLLSCFKQIDHEYFLLMHEFDIVLQTNNEILRNLFKIMFKLKYDRIDLQYIQNPLSHPSGYESLDRDGILVRNSDPSNYIYNVNPSIWKRDSYIELLEEFPTANYREIECVAQEFCKQFYVFKLWAPDYIKCGYFNCLPFFVFFHVTHHGKIIKPNHTFTTEFGQSYAQVANDYLEMYEKYNMANIKLEHYLG